MVWIGRSVVEGDREEFIAMVKIYATERQFPRIFKIFFLCHAWEALEKKRKLPSPLPFYSTHPPYHTPQKGGRKLSSVGKWKWNFSFYIFIYFFFGVHWRLSCDDELNSQFLMYGKQKKKKKKHKISRKNKWN